MPIMTTISHEIERLRTRAGSGDPAALREFESRFASPLRRIVRRVLRLNRAETPLERGIMREAQRQRAARTEGDGEQLVSLLTRRLCEAVFAAPAGRREALFATTGANWPVETEAL
jgi:hypothetical protein